MTVSELVSQAELVALSAFPEDIGIADVTDVIVCDLMSEVLTRGRSSMAWITVQTHCNVAALAEHLRMPIVIVPYGIAVPLQTIRCAESAGVAVAGSHDPTYRLCEKLLNAGIGGEARRFTAGTDREINLPFHDKE